MTDTDLDRAYTALSESLGQVGEEEAPLLLSMLCLALMSRCDRAEDVLPLIDQARLQCTARAGDAA